MPLRRSMWHSTTFSQCKQGGSRSLPWRMPRVYKELNRGKCCPYSSLLLLGDRYSQITQNGPKQSRCLLPSEVVEAKIMPGFYRLLRLSVLAQLDHAVSLKTKCHLWTRGSHYLRNPESYYLLIRLISRPTPMNFPFQLPSPQPPACTGPNQGKEQTGESIQIHLGT